LVFDIEGKAIPADHSYSLFGALSDLYPPIHGKNKIGIHFINGKRSPDRLIVIEDKSRLIIRCGMLEMPHIISQFSSKRINIGGHKLWIKNIVKGLRPMTPTDEVYSKMVTYKDVLEPQEFIDFTEEVFKSMGLSPDTKAEIAMTRKDNSFEGGASHDIIKRTVTIKGKKIIGYALRVWDLTPEDSVKLQTDGLGGRRHFGCGLFRPHF